MPVTLPDAEEFSDMLGLLLGDPVELSPGEPFGETARDDVYCSFLSDDGGEVLGAIEADLPAVVYLGGSLIMLPENALRAQAEDGDVSAHVMDAFQEVVNTLRSTLNHIRENPHVSPGPLQMVTEEIAGEHAWMNEPAETVALEGEFPIGTGRLVVLAR
jgi:hypothetical protein